MQLEHYQVISTALIYKTDRLALGLALGLGL